LQKPQLRRRCEINPDSKYTWRAAVEQITIATSDEVQRLIDFYNASANRQPMWIVRLSPLDPPPRDLQCLAEEPNRLQGGLSHPVVAAGWRVLKWQFGEGDAAGRIANRQISHL
jgi:hypothetical protein